MKSISALFLSLLFSLAAFAGDSVVELKGKDADALLNLLTDAGAYVDCGRMRCGTNASDLTCSEVKYEKNGTTCTLSVQNERGTLTKRRLSGVPAEKLMDTLINADVAGCGMESCQGQATTIDCSFSSPDATLDTTLCTIEK